MKTDTIKLLFSNLDAILILVGGFYAPGAVSLRVG